MLCYRNVFEKVFGKLFGEKRTSLPIGPAVTYDYTLHWPSVAEHTSHPMHKSGLKRDWTTLQKLAHRDTVPLLSILFTPNIQLFPGRKPPNNSFAISAI